MKYKTFSLLACMLLAFLSAKPQEAKNTPQDSLKTDVKEIKEQLSSLKKIRFSGFILSQFQHSDSAGINTFAGGNFNPNSNNRFCIRSARIKLAYTGKMTLFAFQLDATTSGVVIKDLYAQITEPWLKTASLTVGCFDVPFGFEVGYSSALRESPERARMSQTIFPGEKDLGAMITLQAPKTSKLNFLKLDAGMFNGTGSTALDFDKKKNFIGHLSFSKSFSKDKIKVSGGVSYFNGGWRQNTKYIYSMGVNKFGYDAFMVDSTSFKPGDFVKSEYYGVDAQITFNHSFGATTLRGETIWGQQASEKKTTATPKAQPTGDAYLRPFKGAYLYFIQNIGKTKNQLIIKYDWYDPNSKRGGTLIGSSKSNLNEADIKYATLGIGWAYLWDDNIKFTLYYDRVKNETTSLKGYASDIRDNVITVRMQYKF